MKNLKKKEGKKGRKKERKKEKVSLKKKEAPTPNKNHTNSLNHIIHTKNQ